MDELLNEIIDMLDNGSCTDFADTRYAVIAKIKQYQNPNQDPATCEHDWRLAYRELSSEEQEPKFEGDIPAAYFERCTICNETRPEPPREPSQVTSGDEPGQMYIPVPGMVKVAVDAANWEIVDLSGKNHGA